LYSAIRENTGNALNETQCHTNRCVFKSRRNWSGPTAGSRKLPPATRTDPSSVLDLWSDTDRQTDDGHQRL